MNLTLQQTKSPNQHILDTLSLFMLSFTTSNNGTVKPLFVTTSMLRPLHYNNIKLITMNVKP